MNDIVLYSNRGWSAVLAVVCLVSGLLCAGVLVFHDEVQTRADTLMKIGVAAVLLLGGFVINLYRLVKPVPRFIVNREGITDRASVLKVGLIRWEEIAEITVSREGWVTLLGIMVKDPEKYYGRLPSDTAAALRVSFKRRPVHVGIPQSCLSMPVDTLSHQIIAYRQAFSTTGVAPPPVWPG